MIVHKYDALYVLTLSQEELDALYRAAMLITLAADSAQKMKDLLGKHAVHER